MTLLPCLLEDPRSGRSRAREIGLSLKLHPLGVLEQAYKNGCQTDRIPSRIQEFFGGNKY